MFNHSRIRKSTGLLALVIAGVAAMSAYAYTAGNTFDAVNAAAGNSAMAGYAVTDVEYTFSANGEDYTSVSFDANAPVTAADAALSAEGTTPTSGDDYYACDTSSATSENDYNVTCNLTATPVGGDYDSGIGATDAGVSVLVGDTDSDIGSVLTVLATDSTTDAINIAS